LVRKIIFCLIIVYLLKGSVVYAQTDPVISAIINSISIDSLYENLRELTGEKSVLLSNGNAFISSRSYSDDGNLLAEEYLQMRLQKYGLNSSIQRFNGGGGNIIGIQLGKKKPNQKIIICAHFDNRPYTGSAPGADDNGSGTSAVLEAARVLSKLETNYTIVYALWDNEETGLNGSSYYAQQAGSERDSIIAVINMDMIGWDSDNDNLAEIHSRNVSNSNQLAGKMVNVNDLYGIGLNLVLINPGIPNSDHSSFWNYNYSAILLIENYSSINGKRDFNAYYHTSNDALQFINKPFFEKCAKLSIATLANYSKLQTINSEEKTIPSTFSLHQNYPNPFNSSTIIKYSLITGTYVKLVVYDVLGREVATILDTYKSPNNYEIKFDTEKYGALTSGIYFYALYAGGNLIVRKMVLAK